MDKVLAFAEKILKEKIDKNSIVVDATCGNGNDTLFLAKTIAKRVVAFDIQDTAINNTKKLLTINGVEEKVKLILDSHENFEKYIAEKISAVIFNLGYLPNANHSVTTLGEVTKNTIEKMLPNLEIGGRIAIVIYWGHKEGKEEKDILMPYFANINQKYVEVLEYRFINQKNNAPYLVILEKIKDI
ncbi:methyltransferase domain-containing protein [Gemella sp. GH3]|uniref:class I SAM-dependent methyltransferase n=1 Tax=unclassified Gemella TaxID=2624949 RepID=UPI0015D09977|nr:MULTISPECIES: class I SAM-dependent methyltransferase [unclassified Gemella]MBF0714590.1 methyltransferase domain-containing protein [Gemella sp. GH3.1]NYS51542.1 methyltransferase domain-containing protein [Gemella sp. GH3]